MTKRWRTRRARLKLPPVRHNRASRSRPQNRRGDHCRAEAGHGLALTRCVPSRATFSHDAGARRGRSPLVERRRARRERERSCRAGELPAGGCACSGRRCDDDGIVWSRQSTFRWTRDGEAHQSGQPRAGLAHRCCVSTPRARRMWTCEWTRRASATYVGGTASRCASKKVAVRRMRSKGL